MRISEFKFGYSSASKSYSDLLVLDDERLMQEVRTGNADAFAVVSRRYHRLVHVTALRILRDVAEAEDMTQTVFFEIYRNAGQFDSSKGTLKVWLLQYAYSRSANRRNYLMVRHFNDQTEVSEIDRADRLWSPARLQLQETRRLTEEVLSCLPAAERQTIEMFFYQGLTFKEISEERRETYSNVRHHYYRGLERLRSYLEESKSQDKEAQVVVQSPEASPC